MPWVRNAQVAEHYEREELDVARDLMRAVRVRRGIAATALFNKWLAGQAFPCGLTGLLDKWEAEARREIVSEPHMGKRGGPIPGFGRIWASRLLRKTGYVVSGERKRLSKVAPNMSTYFEVDDRRVIHAPEGEI